LEATVEDFYEELLGYARQLKQKRQAGETPEPLKLNESRKQLQAHLDPPLSADLDQLLKRLSFLFYIRGYKDSARHQQTLGKAAKPPKGRERFNEAVRNMLEQNIEMTDEQICTELDRLRGRVFQRKFECSSAVTGRIVCIADTISLIWKY
jgi:hypothetical protein